MEKKLGPAHPHLAAMLNNRASLLQAQVRTIRVFQESSRFAVSRILATSNGTRKEEEHPDDRYLAISERAQVLSPCDGYSAQRPGILVERLFVRKKLCSP